MNAHNEQLLISSLQAAATGNTTTLKMMELCGAAAKALSSNPTNQPAAAQEAVGWFTDDYLTDKSATTYDPLVAERWRNKGWPVTALYAAPVTAAPEASYFEYLDRYNHSLRRAIHAMMAKLVFLLDEDQFADIEAIALAAGVTPAAPGIDLEQFREPVTFWFEHIVTHPFTETNAARLHKAKHLLARIDGQADASPKGTTLNEQFGSAEGLGSPKGGSEARDAVLAELVEAISAFKGKRGAFMALGAQDARTVRLWSVLAKVQAGDAPAYTTGHCENHKKPGGCPLHNLQCGYPRCDRRQAGDAGVQP